MSNHIHIVVGTAEVISPSEIIGDFESYGSRALNNRWPRPESGTWWTAYGSKRYLRDEAAIVAAVEYVLSQAYPLVIWRADNL